MKSVFYYNNEDVRCEELLVPSIQEGEVLVKMRASGVCGSDVIWDYRKAQVEKAIKQTGRGIVLGHEVSGEIIESKNPKWKKGDRVVVAHHVPCGECTYCKKGFETSCDLLRSTSLDPGGFSEIFRVPKVNMERGIFKLPDNVSFDDGSFVEPLGCVIRGQRKLNLNKDDSLLIMGTGIAGILHFKLAIQKGLKNIFVADIDDFRLSFANKLGAKVLNSESNQQLFSKIIICVGVQGILDQAIGLLDRGGSILYFAAPKTGISIPFSIHQLKDEITIASTYGAAPRDMQEALDLLASGSVIVSDMITHRFEIDDVAKAFALTAKPNKSLKILIVN